MGVMSKYAGSGLRRVRRRPGVSEAESGVYESERLRRQKAVRLGRVVSFVVVAGLGLVAGILAGVLTGSVVWGRVAAVGFGVLMFVLGAAVMALTGGGRVLRLYLGRRRL